MERCLISIAAFSIIAYAPTLIFQNVDWFTLSLITYCALIIIVYIIIDYLVPNALGVGETKIVLFVCIADCLAMVVALTIVCFTEKFIFPLIVFASLFLVITIVGIIINGIYQRKEEKKAEAERKVAEEKAAAAERKAAEQKAAEEKAATERKAALEKAAAERKAFEAIEAERKAAERKVAEEKVEAERKAQIQTQISELEKQHTELKEKIASEMSGNDAATPMKKAKANKEVKALLEKIEDLKKSL